MSTARIPCNQTVVLKGFGANVGKAEMSAFVRGVTPRVLSVLVMKDPRFCEGDATDIAYLNYSSPSEATEAKLKIEKYVQEGSSKLATDFSSITAYIKPEKVDRRTLSQAGRPPQPPVSQPITFAVWVSNIVDEDAAQLKEIFESFGELTSLPLHGLPPIKVFDNNNRSAIVNFVEFESAKSLLDACASRKLKFGLRGNARMIASAVPHANTKFALEIEKFVGQQKKRAITLKEAERIAGTLGEHKPERWIEVLPHCSVTIEEDYPEVKATVLGPCIRPILASSARHAGIQAADQSPRQLSDTKRPLPTSQQPQKLEANLTRQLNTQCQVTVEARLGNSSQTGLSDAAPLVPPDGPKENGVPIESWNVTQTCAFLTQCGFDCSAVLANGVDGKTLLDLLNEEQGRALMLSPIEEGGMGLKALQLWRLRAELRRAANPASDQAAQPSSTPPPPSTQLPSPPFPQAGEQWTRDPVTGIVMSDPVALADGETYDRTTVERTFAARGVVSPLTGEALTNAAVTPNKSVRALVARCHPDVHLAPWRGIEDQ